DQTKLPGVQPRVTPNIGQVSAHEREVMVAARAADRAQALERVLVVDMTSERVTGVRGISDDSTLTDDLRRLANRSHLRCDGMQLEVMTGHEDGLIFVWRRESGTARGRPATGRARW